MSSKPIIFCDKCTTSIAPDYDEDRHDFYNRVQDLGWASIRSHGEWSNFCATCMTQTKANAA